MVVGISSSAESINRSNDDVHVRVLYWIPNDADGNLQVQWRFVEKLDKTHYVLK